jgi:hypothetical protein
MKGNIQEVTENADDQDYSHCNAVMYRSKRDPTTVD